MRSLKVSIVFLFVTVLAAACGQATNTSNNNSNTAANTGAPGNSLVGNATSSANNQAHLVDGKEVYALNCQKCHQDSGKGGKVTVNGKNLDVADLTSDKVKKHDDAKLAKDILNGSPDDGMPAFVGKLSIDELNAVISRIRTLQGGK